MELDPSVCRHSHRQVGGLHRREGGETGMKLNEPDMGKGGTNEVP